MINPKDIINNINNAFTEPDIAIQEQVCKKAITTTLDYIHYSNNGSQSDFLIELSSFLIDYITDLE